MQLTADMFNSIPVISPFHYQETLLPLSTVETQLISQLAYDRRTIPGRCKHLLPFRDYHIATLNDGRTKDRLHFRILDCHQLILSICFESDTPNCFHMSQFLVSYFSTKHELGYIVTY